MGSPGKALPGMVSFFLDVHLHLPERACLFDDRAASGKIILGMACFKGNADHGWGPLLYDDRDLVAFFPEASQCELYKKDVASYSHVIYLPGGCLQDRFDNTDLDRAAVEKNAEYRTV
jgi:hypothetical protein